MANSQFHLKKKIHFLMRKKYVTLNFCVVICLLFIFTTGFSQTLSGTIIDKETQETVAFANVLIGDSYGVITNNEGRFEIAVDRFKPSDSLAFSFLGYARQAIAIKDFNENIIYLVPSVDNLDEVYLIDKNLDPLKILEKVNENISKNFKNGLFFNDQKPVTM